MSGAWWVRWGRGEGAFPSLSYQSLAPSFWTSPGWLYPSEAAGRGPLGPLHNGFFCKNFDFSIKKIIERKESVSRWWLIRICFWDKNHHGKGESRKNRDDRIMQLYVRCFKNYFTESSQHYACPSWHSVMHVIINLLKCYEIYGYTEWIENSTHSLFHIL